MSAVALVPVGMEVGLVHLQDQTLAARRPRMRVEGPSELIGIGHLTLRRSNCLKNLGKMNKKVSAKYARFVVECVAFSEVRNYGLHTSVRSCDSTRK